MNTTMRVLRYNGSPATPALFADSAPLPTPGPSELLIRVHAAGVTPTELRWYPTAHRHDGSERTDATGLQTVGWLAADVCGDREFARRAAARGVEVVPLSDFAVSCEDRQGLQIGFASADRREGERPRGCPPQGFPSGF